MKIEKLIRKNPDIFKNKYDLKSKTCNVAIIDTGIDTSNEFIKGYNVKNVYTIKNDWHGTAVASCILMQNEKACITNYGKDNLKISQLPNLISKAIEEGNTIINISMNTLMNASNRTNKKILNELNDMVRLAARKKVKIVVAAGNLGINLDELYKNNILYVPAMLNGIITVGSNDLLAKKESYSNYGSFISTYFYGGNQDKSIIVAGDPTFKKMYSGQFGTSFAAAMYTGRLSMGD